MQRFLKLLLAAALAAPLSATAVFAHAFLDHAVPGVGMTVSGPVREIRIWYTQGVVTAFSAATVTVLFAITAVVAFLPWHGRVWYSSMLHLGALLLISQAWLGHAAQGGAGLYGAIMITVYVTHALATAAWVGGLPPLLFALVEQRRFAPNEARECTLDILSRFSLMAMVAVTLLLASGIANAGFRAPDPSANFSILSMATRYSRKSLSPRPCLLWLILIGLFSCRGCAAVWLREWCRSSGSAAA
jgi:putative copper export protein